MPAVILVVEDEEATANLLKSLFESAHYRVVLAPNAFRARGALNKNAPDLIVLDRYLPDGDGFDLCREIRRADSWKNIPILFLSARKSVSETVSGLQLGGNDYMGKPFNNSELLARVAVLLRPHDAGKKSKVLQSGPLRMDLVALCATLNDAPLTLWPKEFSLLRFFLERRNHALSREVLLKSVWGYDKQIRIGFKTVDVTVSRLRKKLGPFGKRIEFVWGYGYRYADPDAPASS